MRTSIEGQLVPWSRFGTLYSWRAVMAVAQASARVGLTLGRGSCFFTGVGADRYQGEVSIAFSNLVQAGDWNESGNVCLVLGVGGVAFEHRWTYDSGE